jgi:hypothetical protein
MNDQQVTIIESTPGHVRAKFGDRTVKIGCEVFARGYGSPDFVLYKNSINQWDPPHDAEPIDESAKDAIIQEIKSVMETEMNSTVEIE